MSVILDASALLALLAREPGAARVEQALAQRARIGAVNLSEVAATRSNRGVPDATVFDVLSSLELEVVPFDTDLALDAGVLRAATRARGLSLGDRACLALARRTGSRALTCDAAWAGLDLAVDVEIVR